MTLVGGDILKTKGGQTRALVEKKPAIVLGGGVNGLGVIRSLGRLGVPIALISIDIDGDHAHRSRYLSFAKKIPRTPSDEAIFGALNEASEALPAGRPILIPTADRFSHFLSCNQSTLCSRYILNCADKETNDSFLDKWNTAEICEENGVRIPSTKCPETKEDLEDLSESLAYPVIVKPRYTFDASFPGKNATLSDAGELLDFFDSNAVLGKSVVQEIIPSGDGDIIVIASYSDSDGFVKAMYSGRKIRQHLPDYGATCFGISETYPELREQTRKFLNAIGYRGFAMVEFARSRQDGSTYFLELNTRTSWTNQHYADAGVDLTQIAYLDMANCETDQTKQPVVQVDNVVWLDFRRDVVSMRLKRREGKITFWGWFRSLFRAKSFAHWDRRDPRPFFDACGWQVLDALKGVNEFLMGKAKKR